eukprot:PhM_4_TR13896/c0_g2_i2/m.5457
MDKILGRFVLIIVLYVNAERFLLPPIYEARGSTFDGISTGRAIINVLKTHLGDDIAKLRVMMVDGCPVNGVAVRYVNAALADVVTNRITSIPANDRERPMPRGTAEATTTTTVTFRPVTPLTPL